MNVIILITLVFGVVFTLDQVDRRADEIENLIERLHRENHAKDQEKQTRT